MPAFRFALALCLIPAAVATASAATPKEIDAAVKKGKEALRFQYQDKTPAQVVEGPDGIGPAALAGLALLESGVPADDAAVKVIAAAVRDAAFGEVRTYQLTLCLLFLDRLGETSDVPLIQMLGVRLLAGQNNRGGWTYTCTEATTPAEEARLRAALMVVELKAEARNRPQAENAAKPDPAKVVAEGRLHPEVQKYAARLSAVKRPAAVDDNSNTQFGILGVWAARRQGVAVEAALDHIERRFLTTQTAAGGWPYSGPTPGTPSMTCAGLLGLATAVARREERVMRANAPRRPAPGADVPDPPAKNPVNRPPDARDAAVRKAFASLAASLGGKGNAAGLLTGNTLGDRDFYFLWSLERVGVIYDTDTIGNVDWYAAGADALVEAQHATGGWGRPPQGTMVETSFALLFLSRSNLSRDLTAKVRNAAMVTELRAGRGAAAGVAAAPRVAGAGTPPVAVPIPAAVPPVAAVPIPTPAALVPAAPVATAVPPPVAADPDARALAAQLIAATGGDWPRTLARLRDARGSTHTEALVIGANLLDGVRREEARQSLAERLTRMSGDTLRAMARAKEVELRRGAVLAMAMKDDRGHALDLIVALGDESELVVRAAHAGLRSLTGEDYGPRIGATPAERVAAIRKWGEWLKQSR